MFLLLCSLMNTCDLWVFWVVQSILSTLMFFCCRFGRKKAAYQAYWSQPDDFQNILISNLMLRDHFPDAMIEALQSILPDDCEHLVTVVNEDDNGSASICLLEPPGA